MTSTQSAPSRIILPDAPADQRALLDAGGVACWSEPIVIDTYEPATPDPYPLFLDRRVYQGSSGRIYPLPMIDAVSHEKQPRAWQAIHLENAYVRLMLLPELGGRIHIGYDKVAGYDFFYRNNVIKPALVGLAGPWISGGVEFNWPQHHRPATSLPVDTRIDREADGAVVVWHSDLDPLQRMRGSHGIRLRPGSSLVEAEVSLHNRTDQTQTFLWWANVAARAHDRYQSFFPDDVAYVADHARRAITAFPRADRPYYGVDYPALAEECPDADRIDVYSNIPVPTSYMITDTDDAFFGGYDHSADAGFVHWADPAIAPGKKQWTWGTGEIGRAWDDQLTDDDGPYVELMAGVYTENQPDFAWLAPGETKRFSQFWYPIHRIGPARQATLDAAVSVGEGVVGVQATRPVDTVVRVVSAAGEVLERSARLTPDAPLLLTRADGLPGTEVDAIDEVIVGVAGADAGGETLVHWRRRTGAAIPPWAATAPPPPGDIDAADELYLTATHLEQYRHPTRDSEPYLAAALERDPADVRAATALARRHLRRGESARAAELLDRALERETRRNLNPRSGETLYLRALVHERRGELDEADRRFGRAAWDRAWQAPSSLARARLALRAGRAEAALRLADAASGIPEATRVAVLALHGLGRGDEAADRLRAHLDADPLDAGAVALARALGVDADTAPAPTDPRALLDIGGEIARAGAHRVALTITDRPAAGDPGFGNAEPLRLLLRAHWAREDGDESLARRELAALAGADRDLAFPAGLDQLDALDALLAGAATDEPERAALHALRGMWLLDAGRDDAALSDLRAACETGGDPVAHRNLALAIVRTGGEIADADDAYARALALRADARLVFERDLLARLGGASASERLATMEQTPSLVTARDDLALAYVTLLLDVGRVGEAWQILTTRTFRPFEGGEGQALAAYDRAACEIARDLLARGEAVEAAALLRSGLVAPRNLGEGRHPAVPQAERLVLLGDALWAAGDVSGARGAWLAACAPSPLAVAPRAVELADHWIAVAHERLGERAQADAVRRRLRDRADELEAGRDDVDYFATSLPELLVFDLDTAAARHAQAALLRTAADTPAPALPAESVSGARA